MKVVLVDCLIYQGVVRPRRTAPSPDRDEPTTIRMKRAHCLWLEQFQIDAPMFCQGLLFIHLEIGKILVLLSADTTGMGRSRWRAGSYQVTRSAGWKGSR